MVTEVDHHAVKTRIRDILKDDPALYDSTGEPAKLVDVFVKRCSLSYFCGNPGPRLLGGPGNIFI